MIADLTLFYGWPPESAWGMTITRLLWWAKQANRQAEARANASRSRR
ncbi:MAG: GpE family phage tail protein [Alphaproteobacteria bacterium]|nr:GpE family phage tail protein [Alphaproteobacteria bacterium]